MSMFKQFQTDTSLEREGVDLNYGDFIVKVSRAGGNNKRFAKVFEDKMKPVRRAVQTETLDPKRAEIILHETFAEAVVMGWSTRVEADSKGKPVEPVRLVADGDVPNSVFVQGIEGPDGSLLPYTVENVVATFKALPELFNDIREQASKMSLFRQEAQADDAGN